MAFLRAVEVYKPGNRDAGSVENEESGVCVCVYACV